MKAIIYSETGDPSVLHLVEREVPKPGAGEVRVRIAISGVNPTDWKSRAGSKPGDPLPFADVVPNQDGAGTIDAIGSGIDGMAIGDRVWTALAAYQLAAGGTAQEFSVLPAERVYPLPSGASFELGASLGVPAITAHRALTVWEDGPSRLASGVLDDTIVLIAGGAGAVGNAAIQLARWAGATVISTVSGPEKAALATAAGAHHIVNYRDSDAADQILAIAPTGVHLIVEVAPAQNAELDAKVIRNRGSIAVYASTGEALSLDIRSLMNRNVRYQFQLLYTLGQRELDAAAEDINTAIAAGAFDIGPERGIAIHRFDLARTADAHQAVQDDTVGTVLIDVAQN